MAEAKVEKMLKEIFKDFEINSNIINTKIKSINLYKKTSKLEVNILSQKPIKIKDVYAFEKYLVKRFMLKEACVHIEYLTNEKTDIKKDWNDILDYLAYKHPLTKALLKDCVVNINENILEIRLKLSGADFLYARKMDELLSEVIFNVFEEKYKVKYIDNNSEEIKQQIEEYTTKLKTEIIKKVQEQWVSSEEKNENAEKNDIPKINEIEKVNAQVSKVEVKKEETKPKEEPIEEEITPLILGRNQNIKDPLVKVIDISIDSGKIALEGEVINTDSRELKSGKFLFMFDLYDGTSTITCKAFIEKEKFKDVSRKDKISKRY